VKLNAFIRGPGAMPLCGTLTLSGASSTGGGYSELKYSWSVFVLDATTAGYEALAKDVANMATTAHTISLAAERFVAGVQYTFVLTVENFLGNVAPAASIVLQQTKSVRAPLMTIFGLSPRQLVASQTSLLQASVAQESCQKGMDEFVFSWVIDLCLNLGCNDIAPAGVNLANAKEPNLLIASNLLKPGKRYRLKLNAYAKGYPLAASSVFVVVDGVDANVGCTIAGGNAEVAASRIAPTRLSVAGAQYSAITWKCIQASGLPCFIKGSSYSKTHVYPHQSSLTFTPESYAIGKYDFTATATSSHGAVVHCSTTIDVVAGEFDTHVSITPVLADVDPTSVVIVTGHIETPKLLSGLAASWSSINVPSPGFSAAFVLDSSSALTATTVGIPTTSTTVAVSLALKAGILSEGLTYRFALTLTRGVEDVFGDVTTTQVGYATIDVRVAVRPAGKLEVGATGRALIDYTNLAATSWSDDTGSTNVEHYFSLVFDDTVVPLTSLTLAQNAHVHLPKASSQAFIRLSSETQSGVTRESQMPVDVISMKSLSATTLGGITKNADNLYTKFQDWSGALMELTAGAVQVNAGDVLDLAAVIGDTTNPAIDFKREAVAFISELFTASPVGLTAAQPLARLLSILGILNINGPTGPLPAADAAETSTLARKVWSAYCQTVKTGTRVPDWVAESYIAAVAPVETNTTDDSRIAFHKSISELATTLVSQLAYGEFGRSISKTACGVTLIGSKKRQGDHTVVKLPSSSLAVLAWQSTDANTPVEMHTAAFRESRPVSSNTAATMVIEAPVLYFDAGNAANSVKASFTVHHQNTSELRCLHRKAGRLDWTWEASDKSSAPAGQVVCSFTSLLARRSSRSATGGPDTAWHFAVASVSLATTQTSTGASARLPPTTVAPTSTVATRASSSEVPQVTQGNVVVVSTNEKETLAPADYGASTVASHINNAADPQTEASTVLVAVLGSLAILLLFGLTYCKVRGRKKIGIWGETLQRSSKQWNEPQSQTWVAPSQQVSKQAAWQPTAPAVSSLPPPLLAPTASPGKVGHRSDGGSNSGSPQIEHRKSLPGLRGSQGTAFVPAQFAPPTKQGASLEVFNEGGDFDVDGDAN